MIPVVGVTSIPKRARSGFGELPHETVPELYLEMVASLGAAPVILPVHVKPSPEVLRRLDGLMLTGGGDVDPAIYGQERGPRTEGVDPDRDRFEIEMVREALDRDLPILAICRGIQVLNVSLGGSLTQDLPSELDGRVNHRDVERWDRGSHVVRTDPESRLGSLLGGQAPVNSIHHQGVDRIGRGLRPVGWAEDGVVEAVELPEARFCLGVQWHPECLGRDDPSYGLFRSFVDEAREVPA
ncbi:MAG TPA: gamma-glutamyl-gamma-aminobutyrate hydrolase family protein [Candidatus Eisenbacteria bacterium]|jgi:gamma-glutamyl-gamma-aminobutyrate hydrolase PuuD